MERSDLGFNKSNTLVVQMFEGIRTNYDAFRNEVEASPYVSQMACSRAVPGQALEYNIFNVNGEACFVWNWAVDDEYMDVMDFRIVEGRGFLKNSEAEDGNYICNETAAKRYNWTVGTKIRDGQLVGIMKDFNMVSLRQQIDPFVFRKESSLGNFGTVTIRLARNNFV